MVDRLVGTEENTRRITNVENCFGISGVSLQNNGRVLVGEGILKKMCRKKLKPRQVFLFNDILVYGSIVIRNKKYTRQHIIPLENVKIEDIEDADGSSIGDTQFGWFVRTPTKSFAVYAASINEKREWINHINMCIKELLDRTGNQPISEHAAVWVPDKKSDVCMHCRKTTFTVLNRKHHCRNCGKIVCGSCSKNSYLIVNISSKPVRVCDSCFVELNHKNNQTRTNGSEQLNSMQPENDDTSDSDSEMRDRSGNNLRDSGRSLEELNIVDQPTTFYRQVPENL